MTGIRGIAALLLLCSSVASAATDHQTNFSARLRYVDLEDAEEQGKARSALLRLNVRSQWTPLFGTLLEIDHVESGNEDEHSDGVRFNGKPTVPDVEGSEINQILLEYKLRSTRAVLGRQAIELHNQRFVGGNAFWQNEQTFDALRLQHQILTQSRLDYSYVANANRIFGDDADDELALSDTIYGDFDGQRPALRLGDHEHDSHLLHASFSEWDFSEFGVYLLIIDNKDAPTTSGDTLGAHYTLKIKPAAISYRFEAELAVQTLKSLDDGDSIPYARSEFGLGLRSTEFSLNLEYLGSRDDVPFSTPLGSLHDFNGWADVFGAPPADGLEDVFLRIHWRKAPWKFDIRWHQFRTAENSEKLGTEVDFDLIFKPAKKHTFLLRFADFEADDASEQQLNDVARLFFNYSYNF